MGKIALFGGTFDPPHNGHIHMMLLLQEMLRFDAMYVIPTNKNPFKETKTAPAIRLEMCRETFKEFPWCKVLDVEIVRGGVSYTIDTIDFLMENDAIFKESEKYLLLGEGSAYSLAGWKEVDRLLSLVQPIVISRKSFEPAKAFAMQASMQMSLQKGWRRMTPLELSSTDIRERVEKKLYVKHLVPQPVFSYIQTHQLYVKE